MTAAPRRRWFVVLATFAAFIGVAIAFPTQFQLAIAVSISVAYWIAPFLPRFFAGRR